MCVVCYVDEAMKDKIIAYDSEFHKVTKSPFGAGRRDRHAQPDRRRRRAMRSCSRADASRVFDLSVDNFVGMPGWFGAGDQPYQIWMTHTPPGEKVRNPCIRTEANELVAYSGDAISMYTHCGTHIDTLNHFGYNGRIFNDFRRTSISAAACGTMRRRRSIRRSSPAASCSTLRRMHGVDVLPPSHGDGREGHRRTA